MAFKYILIDNELYRRTTEDLLLVVQQVSKVCQYYNGSLNAYLDKCLDIISSFDEFVIRHI